MKKIIYTLFFFLLTTQICFAQWVQTSFDSAEVNCIIVKDTNLFVGAWEGVFLSTNNGTNWTAVNNGLTNTSVTCLAVSGSDLFVGTSGGGVFMSTNDGTSWTAVNNGLTNTFVTCLTVSGSNLFAGAGYDGDVFLSTNNGTSWTAVNNGLPEYTSILCLTVSGSNLFAGIHGNGIYLSTNNGTNWTAVNNGLGSVYSIGLCGTNLFAGSWERIFRTTDYGANWFEVYYEFQVIWSLTVTGTNLFAGSHWSFLLPGPEISGVLLTTDLGINWIPVNDGFPSQLNYVTSLAVKDSFLFAAVRPSIWKRPLSEMITSVGQELTQPAEFILEQNYPNPFNPTTTISYSIPKYSDVSIKIFDVLGNEIETMVNEEKPAGNYNVTWYAEQLPSGVYFYQLQAREFVQVKKMLLLK
jgi:photosystem II stability/assembly factor-like uncharacterized protein